MWPECAGDTSMLCFTHILLIALEYVFRVKVVLYPLEAPFLLESMSSFTFYHSRFSVKSGGSSHSFV
jgi:hypothetical protein